MTCDSVLPKLREPIVEQDGSDRTFDSLKVELYLEVTILRNVGDRAREAAVNGSDTTFA